MRNVLKAETLERKFPLLAVENGCIVSKDADLTVAFEVTLPEVYTVAGKEYEAIHSSWVKAIRVLPPFTVVYKQDWFTEERYRPDWEGKEMSFLSRSYERHFNERPYLSHRCFLYVTKTTRERSRQRSDFNTLCKGHILPKEVTDKDAVSKFMESVGQFERILNDSGQIRIRRLSEEEITGTEKAPGIVEKYFSLSPDGNATALQDICLKPEEMRIGDKRLSLHTLSLADDLPSRVATDMRYEKMSTDKSRCNLSFAAPVGLLLSCNHIYSQYVFIDDAKETLQDLEKASRNLLSLSRYNRSNAVNREWVEMYLDEAHSKGLLPVRCHCNVLCWAEDEEELRRIKNDAGSQLALMECTPRHNTIDVPVLYWAGIPGNAGDFPAEESFHTFLEQAVCLFSEETNYRSSPSPFGIRMADRQSGVPVHVDISDLPMKRGITTNRNKFILGPSGSGKSFFTNHLVRQYYEQNAHILLVDIGNSYQGLCRLINSRTKGEDGIYLTYEEDNPIAFNPFMFAMIPTVRRLAVRYFAWARAAAMVTDPYSVLPKETSRRVLAGQTILVGSGSVTKRVVKDLKAQDIPMVSIVEDTSVVEDMRKAGMAVIGGDPTDPMVLVQAHIVTASILVITDLDAVKALKAVDMAKQLNPEIQIYVRASSTAEAEHLRKEGITNVWNDVESISNFISARIVNAYAPDEEDEDKASAAAAGAH